MPYQEKQRSKAWFLLPIFFGVIGGIIAFFILRYEDPHKAKNCLFRGLALMLIGISLNIFITVTIPGNRFNI